MKATIKQVVEAYKVLGEAKVTKLEESEVIKVVKARKAMRPIADEYEAFSKDCQEKFKPENWDKIQGNLQKWQQEGEKTTLTEEERIEVNKAIIGYKFVNFGKMMDFIKAGDDANTAFEKAQGQYGRVADAVKIVDPRKE